MISPKIDRNLTVTDVKSFVLLQVKYQLEASRCLVQWTNHSLIVWEHNDWMMEVVIDNQSYKFLINGIEKVNIPQLQIDEIRILAMKDKILIYVPQSNSEYHIAGQMDLIGDHQVQLINSSELQVNLARFEITQSNNIKFSETTNTDKCNELNKMICDWNQKLKNGIYQILTDLDQTKSASQTRNNFCQIALDGPNHDSDHELIYLTPEISYLQKKRNCHLIKKNNISIKYNHSNTMNEICISNPLVSLRAFFCDFVIKNLILFGLIVLFCLLLGSPSIPAWPTGVIIATVVVLAYNLIYLIFKVIENIFMWACRYNITPSDYLGEDQWTSAAV
jgi:hypothetical protein